MARIEDVAALLTEEIDDFKKAVEKLEQLSGSLSKFTIQADTEPLKEIVEKHLIEQRKMISAQKRVVESLDMNNIKPAPTPGWIIKSRLALAFLGIIYVFYSFYKISTIPDLERAALEKGEEQVKLHFQSFFNENENANEMYNDWIQKNN
jgi:hypothetical protein